MNILRTPTSDGTCILTFDRTHSPANTLDLDTLGELDLHIAALEKESGIRGVILASAKPKVFIAGADLDALAGNPDEHALGEFINQGHRIFTRLNRLKIPSVAAIDGACFGGGLELALACDWRVGSTNKSTRLGLPETQRGNIPAWGGCTRLPRLIGLPRALQLIVTGNQLAATQAQKLGILDDVTHPEYLIDLAHVFVARGKRPAPSQRFLNRAPFAFAIAAKARASVMAKTRGHYPAPLKAIEVCAAAAHGSFEAGLALEKQAFLELTRTPECRNLLSVFLRQERATNLSVAANEDRSESFAAVANGVSRAPTPLLPRHVAVIGAGTMGAGIAQWISGRGIRVRLKDIHPDPLARGLHAIEKLYANTVKGRVSTLAEATAGLDRITPVHTDVPLADVDIVIDTALERLDTKQHIFRDIETRVGPDTVLATSTSALSLDAIASALTAPERLVGLHFFNPVHRVQLVEIVRGPRTSTAALEGALQFTRAIGKVPVIVKDSPGFLVNRVLLPYMVEAVWLFTEGVPAAAIDRLMLRFGMPMGPLRLVDEVGLEVAQHLASTLERRLPNGVPINDTLEKMVAKGWLGKKSGRGFYLHTEENETPAPESDLRFLQAEKPRASDTATRQDRLVLIMVNEAARVLSEGVVETPEDVDFGMIMGTGWAPFRGGPLRYADSLGAVELVRRLDVLAREVAPHFSPCRSLKEMAWNRGGFYPMDTEIARDPRARERSRADAATPGSHAHSTGERASPRLRRTFSRT